MLIARGYVDHRLKGTALYLGMSLSFVYAVRPSTVWELVLSQAAAVVPTFAYYSWVALSRAADRRQFGVRASDVEIGVKTSTADR